MANTLGIYDPIFYAQEALIQLEKALGMANAVFRDHDRSPQDKGSIIQIRRPTSFSSQAMPISAANTSDLAPDTVALTLDQWKGVQFGLTDKELSFTKEVIIEEHIRPAAVAVADDVDGTLTARFIDIPWFVDSADPGAVTDFTSLKQVMFDNKVPNAQRSLMIDGEREGDYLALSVFHQANTSADGDLAQRDGFLARKFGFDIFVNQNVKTHVPGTLGDGSGNDVLGVVDETVAIGLKNMKVDALEATKTMLIGDTFSIAGHDRRYVLTANAVVVSDEYDLTFEPGLEAAVTDGTEVVTVRDQAKKVENLAFHRNCFALAMAPLSVIGARAGAQMGLAVDPITNLALRSRLYYDGFTAKVFISLDALWGVKVLDLNLGVRLNS